MNDPIVKCGHCKKQMLVSEIGTNPNTTKPYSTCPKCRSKYSKKNKQKDSTNNFNFIEELKKHYPEHYEVLAQRAVDNVRTPEQQAIFIIKEALEE